jgi:phage replication O-like protein O
VTNGKTIQIDQGEFTRVHNAILETLAKAKLSPLEFRIVIFLLRKTYGFQKKSDTISITQFESCGGSRTATVTAIKNLIRLMIITRTPNKQGFEYSFNKYIETWLPEVFMSRRPNQSINFKSKTSKPNESSEVNGTSKADGTVTSKADGTVTSKADGTHKRKKETIKDNSEHQRMFGKLSEICKVDPKLKGGFIGKTAQRLIKAGYTFDDLVLFSVWWKENDFRGRKGNPPTMPQLEEMIFQSKQANIPVGKLSTQYEEFWEDGALKFREIETHT